MKENVYGVEKLSHNKLIHLSKYGFLFLRTQHLQCCCQQQYSTPYP